MKKTISLALALMILLTGFISCSENSAGDTQTADEVQSDTETEAIAAAEATDSDDETSAEAEEADEEEETDSRKSIPDDLPDITFDGKTLSMVTENSTFSDYRGELVADELTGDVCNDAIFNRDLLVESRFDVKLEADINEEPHELPRIMAEAGTSEYNLVAFESYKAWAPITAKALVNWLDVPNVNTEKPWHNAASNDGATINGRLYAICSDLSITSMTLTYAIFGNTALLEQFGYQADDIYNEVKEGTWTIDRFAEMIETMYVDENGNSTADDSDTYGFGYRITNTGDVWLTAFGQKVVDNVDGKLVLTFMDQKTTDILDKLLDLHYNNPGYHQLYTQYLEEQFFCNGRFTFAPLRLQAAYSTLRDMEDTYIILPYPKWDEAQEGYYTNADDKFTLFGLPITSADDTEFIGTVFEALCAESYKSVYPSYYDTALKGRYSSDPTTAEMVDIIVDGRMFDFSFQFSESCMNRLCYQIRFSLLNNDNSLSSTFASLKKSTEKSIERTINKAYDIED